MVPANSILIVLIFVSIQLVPTFGCMDDNLRMIGLDAHNKLRSTVALGNAVNKNGTKLPKAVNTRKVSWSRMVESYALQHVQSCNFSHT
jgi:hypothetical protein